MFRKFWINLASCSASASCGTTPPTPGTATPCCTNPGGPSHSSICALRCRLASRIASTCWLNASMWSLCSESKAKTSASVVFTCACSGSSMALFFTWFKAIWEGITLLNRAQLDPCLWLLGTLRGPNSNSYTFHKIPPSEETEDKKRDKKLRTKPWTMHEKVGIIGSGPHSHTVKIYHYDPAW